MKHAVYLSVVALSMVLNLSAEARNTFAGPRLYQNSFRLEATYQSFDEGRITFSGEFFVRFRDTDGLCRIYSREGREYACEAEVNGGLNTGDLSEQTGCLTKLHVNETTALAMVTDAVQGTVLTNSDMQAVHKGQTLLSFLGSHRTNLEMGESGRGRRVKQEGDESIQLSIVRLGNECGLNATASIHEEAHAQTESQDQMRWSVPRPVATPVASEAVDSAL